MLKKIIIIVQEQVEVLFGNRVKTSVGWFLLGDLLFRRVLSLVLTLRTDCSHFG
jgi:hypothetical protein